MPGTRTVVLVEGESDRAAVEAVAERLGRDLADERIEVVAMGGVTNVGRFASRYGPAGLGWRVTGLYDAGEVHEVHHRLARAGLAGAPGFHACDADLEDELIRAVGAAAVEDVITAEGELRAFRTFQRQPAKATQTVEEQLHRFLGTKSGRKIRYGRLLVDALDLARLPAPLAGLLDDLALQVP